MLLCGLNIYMRINYKCDLKVTSASSTHVLSLELGNLFCNYRTSMYRVVTLTRFMRSTQFDAVHSQRQVLLARGFAASTDC